jgi:hypothetical protein
VSAETDQIDVMAAAAQADRQGWQHWKQTRLQLYQQQVFLQVQELQR